MTETDKPKKTQKERDQEKMLKQYTIEKRTINGQEVEVKVYKEFKKRPISEYCR